MSDKIFEKEELQAVANGWDALLENEFPLKMCF